MAGKTTTPSQTGGSSELEKTALKLHSDINEMCRQMYYTLLENESLIMESEDSRKRFIYVLFNQKEVPHKQNSVTACTMTKVFRKTISMILSDEFKTPSEKFFPFLVECFIYGHLKEYYYDTAPLYSLYTEIDQTVNKKINVTDALRIIVPNMVQSYAPSNITEAEEISFHVMLWLESMYKEIIQNGTFLFEKGKQLVKDLTGEQIQAIIETIAEKLPSFEDFEFEPFKELLALACCLHQNPGAGETGSLEEVNEYINLVCEGILSARHEFWGDPYDYASVMRADRELGLFSAVQREKMIDKGFRCGYGALFFSSGVMELDGFLLHVHNYFKNHKEETTIYSKETSTTHNINMMADLFSALREDLLDNNENLSVVREHVGLAENGTIEKFVFNKPGKGTEAYDKYIETLGFVISKSRQVDCGPSMEIF